MLRIHHRGDVLTCQPLPGETLWKALQRVGIAINAPCGGRAFCGKCKVRVAFAGQAPELLPAERDRLSGREIEGGVRLACVVKLDGLGDADVWVEQEQAAILTGGSIARLDRPAAYRVRVTPPTPSLEDPRDDLTRLEAAVGTALQPTVVALSALPEAMRRGGDVGATLFAHNGYTLLLDVGAEGPAYGVAVDIGTTTLAAFLMNLETGEQLDVLSQLNPQGVFGADVIARCDAAATAEGLAAMRDAVRKAISGIIASFIERNGIAARDIAHVTLVGNTVMMHLLAGISPAAIAVIPFVPAFAAGITLPAETLDLPLPCAMASLLPSVAGYVGADTVAAGLSSFEEASDASLPTEMLIDIGTNGEMALRVGDKLFCCSTAAGPAFEGAHIKHGMGGVAGAISRVRFEDGVLRCETVANQPARGICGSGLLDAVAVLLAMGVLDETGAMDEDEAPEGVSMPEIDGKPALLLAEGEDGPIVLTARDVREVQLAKAAIAAGIESLAEQAGIAIGDIQKVMLAGGFGSYLDIDSACAIGLLPAQLRAVTHSVGNAAGSGARVALLSREALDKAEDIRARMHYIELSALPAFQDRYIEQMMFS